MGKSLSFFIILFWGGFGGGRFWVGGWREDLFLEGIFNFSLNVYRLFGLSIVLSDLCILIRNLLIFIIVL